LYIIFTRRGTDIDEYPAIEEHLKWWRKGLEPKKSTGQRGPGRKPGNYKWYEIQDSIDYYEEFSLPKVVWATIANNARFAYANAGVLSNQKTYIAPGFDLADLVILNSDVFFVIAAATALAARQHGYYEWERKYMWTLPIVSATNSNTREVMTNLSSEIIKTQPESERIRELELRANEIAYELYRLSAHERTLVQEWARVHSLSQEGMENEEDDE